MLVRFVTRAVYDTLGPGKGPVYEKGSVHDLEHHEAERWFRRNMGVPEPEPQAAPQAAPQKSEPPVAPVEIPEGFRDLAWQALRELAHAVAPDLKNPSKADCIEAIEAEVVRRAAAAADAEANPAGGAQPGATP